MFYEWNSSEWSSLLLNWVQLPVPLNDLKQGLFALLILRDRVVELGNEAYPTLRCIVDHTDARCDALSLGVVRILLPFLRGSLEEPRWQLEELQKSHGFGGDEVRDVDRYLS
jgi:hypothetical protein